MKSVIQFKDYKSYLREVEAGIKGFRSRLAEAAECQNAFVSQVLNGDVNFNLEQALRIAGFLGLRGDHEQAFLWLVEVKRAGTPQLRAYFNALLDQLREKHLNIGDRVKITQALSSEDQSRYYSSWMYAAIHIAVMVPEFNSVSALSAALGISEKQVDAVVEFLVEHGLVQQTSSGLRSGHIQTHLSKDSPDISKHHTNWRIEAIKSLDQPGVSDMHYSGVSSLAKADVEKIRAIFVDTIEAYVRAIEKSPEETLYTFNLDFFRVSNS